MTDARVRLFWHRAGPLAAFAALAVVAAAEGCGGGSETTSSSSTSGSGGSGSSTTTTSTSTTTSTTGSGGATTGTGGSTPFGGMISPVADVQTALDATPDPAGAQIYFTGVDSATGAAGVYKAPADGSNKTPVLLSSPFAAPFGIAISSDNKTLYVADPGATDAATKLDHGVIFTLPIAGGMPTVLMGSEGLSARSLELVVEGGKDVLYFAGSDATTGARGVYKMPAGGGAAAAITATGVTWVDPSGIAVAADGTVFVVDTTGAPTHKGVIVKVASGGAGTSFASDVQVGYPAGVALSKDGSSLFVSALDPVKHTDVLLQFDVSTAMAKTALSTGIDTLTESAGLHRAQSVDVFAFADSAGGSKNGQVFVVK
jgi:sugar lactone lactonase YvrE